MTILLALLALQDYDGPLYDSHCHGSPAVDTSPKQMVELLKKAGIERTILFLGPKQEPIEGVAVCLLPLMDPQTKKPLFTQETVDYLEKKLKAGGVKGIGELALHHRGNKQDFDAAGEIPKKIYDLAAKYKVPVNVHVEATYVAELDRAVAHNRDAKFIWAHAGDATPAVIRERLKKHPNLYADLSCRNPLFKRGFAKSDQAMTDDRGKLTADWKKLLEDCPDRFLFGSDVGGKNSDRLELLPEIVKYYRSVLGQIPKDAAEKIAWKNAEALFGK